jgi:hypothetical protein
MVALNRPQFSVVNLRFTLREIKRQAVKLNPWPNSQAPVFDCFDGSPGEEKATQENRDRKCDEYRHGDR